MDIFKGITIFLIVLGHLDWPLWFLRMFIGFHISLFFMFTGFFIFESVKRYSFWQYFKQKLSQIMRVYLACLILQLGFTLLADVSNQKNILDVRIQDFFWVLLTGSNHHFKVAGYSSYLWFLPIFFIFLIFLFFIFKNKKKNLFVVFVAIFLLSVLTVGFTNARVYDTLYYPYNLDKIFIVLVLGFLGHYIRSIRTFLEKNSKLLLFISSLIIVIFFNMWQMSLRHMQMSSVSLFFVYAIVGFIFVFSLSHLISQKRYLYKIKNILVFWGENTLGIYVLHTFLNQWVPFYMGVNFSQNTMYNVVMLVFTFACYWLFHRFFDIANFQF